MIFKITFPDKILFAQAKNLTHLIFEYSKEYDDYSDINIIEIISEEKAKEITLKNIDQSTFEEYPEFTLYNLVVGNDFCIVGSTEWI